jgi:hypothetical protein
MRPIVARSFTKSRHLFLISWIFMNGRVRAKYAKLLAERLSFRSGPPRGGDPSPWARDFGRLSRFMSAGVVDQYSPTVAPPTPPQRRGRREARGRLVVVGYGKPSARILS